MKATKRYGLGFRGFNATSDRMTTPRDQVSSDSRDWILDPREGAWVRRRGSVILGDTAPDAGGQLFGNVVLPT